MRNSHRELINNKNTSAPWPSHAGGQCDPPTYSAGYEPYSSSLGQWHFIYSFTKVKGIGNNSRDWNLVQSVPKDHVYVNVCVTSAEMDKSATDFFSVHLSEEQSNCLNY